MKAKKNLPDGNMAKFERTDKLKIKKEKSDHSLEKREEKKLRKLKNKES